jgi:hypothetical protein
MRGYALFMFFVCFVASSALTRAAAGDPSVTVRTAPIVNVPLADAAAVLRRFASRPEAVRVDEARRTVNVTDTASKMPLLLRLVQAMEQARPGQEVWVEPSKGLGRPSQYAERLTDLFAPSSGAPAARPAARFAAQPEPAPAAGGLGGLPPSGTFIADDETGALVIVADENTYRHVLELLARGAPDHPTQGDVHVLPLARADAREIVRQLSPTLEGLHEKPPPRVTADVATNSIVLIASPAAFETLAKAVKALDVQPGRVLLEVAVTQEVSPPWGDVQTPSAWLAPVLDNEARRKLWRTLDARVIERTVLLTTEAATNELRVDVAPREPSPSGERLREFRVFITVRRHAPPDQLELDVDVAACTRPGAPCQSRAMHSTVVLHDTETVAIPIADGARSTLLVVVTANTLGNDDVDLARLLRQRQLEREEARVAEALFGPARKLAPLRVDRSSRGLVTDIRRAQHELAASP